MSRIEGGLPDHSALEKRPWWWGDTEAAGQRERDWVTEEPPGPAHAQRSTWTLRLARGGGYGVGGGGGWGRVGQGGCGAPRTGLGEAGCPEAPEPQHWVRLLCPASERSARQHHGVRPLGDNFWPLGALRQVGSWGGSVEGRRPRGAAVTWVEASVGSVSFRCSEVLALRSRYENTFHPVCLREVGRLPSRLLVQTLGIWRQALPTARRRALGVHLGS